MPEIIGTIGTIIILLAFTFNEEREIRIYDALGAAFFVAYGILTRTWSTAVLNAFLICINCYKIFKRG